MELEKLIYHQELIFKEYLKMVKQMDMADIFMSMEGIIKDKLLIIMLKEKENMILGKDILIRDYGKRIYRMVEVLKNIFLETHIKES
jgi:hypothetical protein